MIILCSTIIVLLWIVLIIELALMIKLLITSNKKHKNETKIEFIAGIK